MYTVTVSQSNPPAIHYTFSEAQPLAIFIGKLFSLDIMIGNSSFMQVMQQLHVL